MTIIDSNENFTVVELLDTFVWQNDDPMNSFGAAYYNGNAVVLAALRLAAANYGWKLPSTNTIIEQIFWTNVRYRHRFDRERGIICSYVEYDNELQSHYIDIWWRVVKER